MQYFFFPCKNMPWYFWSFFLCSLSVCSCYFSNIISTILMFLKKMFVVVCSAELQHRSPYYLYLYLYLYPAQQIALLPLPKDIKVKIDALVPSSIQGRWIRGLPEVTNNTHLIILQSIDRHLNLNQLNSMYDAY